MIGDHDWPAELVPGALCEQCGLDYAEWSVGSECPGDRVAQQRRRRIDPNPAIVTIIRGLAISIDLDELPVHIEKVQPPDGLVLRLSNGSLWNVMAYRAGEKDPSPIMLDPDCRAGKHASCVGDPCACHCHR